MKAPPPRIRPKSVFRQKRVKKRGDCYRVLAKQQTEMKSNNLQYFGMRDIRRLTSSLLHLQTPFFLVAPMILLLLAARDIALAQSVTGNLRAVSGNFNAADRILLGTKTIYQTNYLSDTVEIFSLSGFDRGTFATPVKPTGLVFDDAGNLYVSSDNPAAYSILKFAPDGSVTIFANTGLGAPHGLVFDTAGNLYVANMRNDTIVKFTPDGVGTVFADADDGLVSPIDLAFDTAGNLYVSNITGGPAGNGRVLKFTPDRVGSV